MRYKKVILAAVAAAVVFSVTSCEDLLRSLFGVSIEERIVAFEKTLNTSDRADFLDHIHPDMKNRNQLNDPQVIDVSPLGHNNADFDFGDPVVNDENVATCSFQNANGTGTIEFTMALDGYDWKILKLYLTVGAIDYELKRLLTKTAGG